MTDPPALDLLTMGRLFTVELPDGRGPLTVVADHVQTNGDVLLDRDSGRARGRLWEVDLACASAEALPTRLGPVGAGRSLLTSNGWAVTERVGVRLDWWLERHDGVWRSQHSGALHLGLLYPHHRP